MTVSGLLEFGFTLSQARSMLVGCWGDVQRGRLSSRHAQTFDMACSITADSIRTRSYAIEHDRLFLLLPESIIVYSLLERRRMSGHRP